MSNDKSIPQDSNRSLIKHTTIMSLGTLSSRVLGFLRDVVIAKLFGTGLTADAFFVALKIPNLFRNMLAEGAAQSAVVPVFSEYLSPADQESNQKKEEFWKLVNIVFILAIMTLSCLTIAGIFLAPVIVRLLVPGFIENPDKLILTIRLTKIMFPYLILVGISAYSMAVLFTFRSFLVPAFSPCLLNISIILSAFVASRFMDEPVFGLAAGVLIGGFLQMLVQTLPLRSLGFRFIWPKTLYHPGASKIFRLIVPRMIGAGIYPLTVLIDVFCASLATIVGVGGISAIYYANRIILLPIGLFSVSLASAVLPALSSMAAQKKIEEMRKTILFSLENILFILCPATVIILLLAHPIIRLLFERGAFDSYSTAITSGTLFFYAIGLCSFGSVKILVAAFHSLQDTKTPVKIAALCLGTNALLNFILMFPLKIGGIALASSLSGILNFMILFHFLNGRVGSMNKELRQFFLKILFACVAMAGFLYLTWQYIVLPILLLKLVFLTGASFILYGWLCYLMKIPQALKGWDILIKGRRKKEKG